MDIEVDLGEEAYISGNRELEESRPGPSKWAKTGAGTCTYQTRFNAEWIRSWPFIQEVKKSPYKFLCTVCCRQVNCGHMGKCDVERCIKKPMHISNAKGPFTLALGSKLDAHRIQFGTFTPSAHSVRCASNAHWANPPRDVVWNRIRSESCYYS